jgi:hypothetical protein
MVNHHQLHRLIHLPHHTPVTVFNIPNPPSVSHSLSNGIQANSGSIVVVDVVDVELVEVVLVELVEVVDVELVVVVLVVVVLVVVVVG